MTAGDTFRALIVNEDTVRREKQWRLDATFIGRRIKRQAGAVPRVAPRPLNNKHSLYLLSKLGTI